MKKIIKSKILAFLDKKGFQRKPIGADPKIALYHQMKDIFAPANKEIVSLIFSKDRAMQLDGFLASYFENVDNYSSVKVLFHVSNEEHRNSYKDLERIYAEFPVEFIPETNFRNDLIGILEKANEDRIIFYVDDMLFSQKVDYNWLKEVDPLLDIVSLSRGRDLNYSTALAMKQEIPSFSKISNNLYRFKWNEISEFSDWTYPIGVSGYMFSRQEIMAMIKVTDFKAPNSLEHNLQKFLPYFDTRGGVCLENVATPCVHTNLTQTEGYNNILGYFSLEELLVLWNENKRIDYKEFFGLKVSEAEVKKYNFINRT
ncbi:hypothetical protein I6H88_11115 [Elizabethkingia bruuniana]|uniref:Glycosyl transferase family 2 n=1 Tax=Elizabethkingia bruuniana TaxID=1756149 RepID=A0A7T7ZWC6_9FLAO|nr:hypothetical protein [Elizabethkingia bruuniana]KGO11821.1 hypothetical protein KS04_01335 [Elizabethkingia miricola]AQX83614.1 hypothetical protein AYC65_00625 [Elizabethkingia bruuniana]KUY22271.1 hypothetical protein ATB97_13570 [Elizabethkingia bruuniana]OPB62482.1 hypothetical protein BAY12_11310 [Elizabethkingia bruuniana]QQN57012.1 hypothetical protein I6H88_11115 [Elizabethkingia bruuniana]